MACAHGNVIQPGAPPAPCGCSAPAVMLSGLRYVLTVNGRIQEQAADEALWKRTQIRALLNTAIDAEDQATVDAAAILAAGHGVRFVFTVRDGRRIDVRVERLEYDHRGRR